MATGVWRTEIGYLSLSSTQPHTHTGGDSEPGEVKELTTFTLITVNVIKPS